MLNVRSALTQVFINFVSRANNDTRDSFSFLTIKLDFGENSSFRSTIFLYLIQKNSAFFNSNKTRNTAENTVYFIIMREFQIDNLHTE